MLAAYNEGVDSCWINFFNPDELAKAFNLPEDEEILMLLDLGVADKTTTPLPNHNSRKALTAVSYTHLDVYKRQVVYIPGAADIRNENANQAESTPVSKEDKILEYIRQNGSVSSQQAADIGGYNSKTSARKLLDKMIAKGLIKRIGNGPSTKYVI